MLDAPIVTYTITRLTTLFIVAEVVMVRVLVPVLVTVYVQLPAPKVRLLEPV